MSTVTLTKGHVMIDGKPVLIVAAEFHYFRTPKTAWRERLELLKSSGFNTIATYIPWLWHEPQPGQFDLTGVTHPQKDLAGFLDLLAELGFMIIARPGPYIMAETINEGIPPWVFERYPEVAVLDQRGQRQNVYSYNHPQVMPLIDLWYKAVFSVLSPRQWGTHGNIILVQLDNEMGMIAWVRNAIDVNEPTLMRFSHWLNAKEPSLSDRSLQDLKKALCEPKEPADTHVLRAYQRFYREDLKTYTLSLWTMAKAAGMTVPPVINIHGFGDMGRSFPIGISQLVDVMGIEGMMSATDVYPLRLDEGNFHQIQLLNAMTSALQNPHQPLFSIEFQAGGNGDFSGAQSSMTDLHTRLCLFNGMKAFNHYLFMDGENDPQLSPVKRHDWGHPIRKDGTLRSHFHRYPKLNSTIHTLGKTLIEGKTTPITSVGFLIDDYLTEVHTPLTQRLDAEIKHQRNDIQFDLIARFLSLENIPFDAIELSRQTFTPQTHPSLWVMMDHGMAQSVQKKLVNYIFEGGKLILIGRFPQRDDLDQPCTILADALGVQRVIPQEPFSTVLIEGVGYTDIPASFVEPVVGENLQTFAKTSEGLTVGFESKLGLGQVVVLCAAISTNTLDDLDVVRHLARRIGVEPVLKASTWISVRTLKSTQGQLVMLNNYQDDPWEGQVFEGQKALFGGKTIRVAARSGVILPMKWSIDECHTVVWSTTEVREIVRLPRSIKMRFAAPGYVKIRTVSAQGSSTRVVVVDQSLTITL
jgi:beta-galactosidase